MRTISGVIVAGFGVVSLASCGPTIRSDRDENIPVPQGATWAWAAPEMGARAHRGPAPAGEIVQQRFQRAIESAMEAKGYRQVGDTSQADFVLSFGPGEPPSDGRRAYRGGAVVAVGFSGGWAYRPWGLGRFGFYHPWGSYQPFGVGFYEPMWGYAAPMYPAGYRSYSDRVLVAVLRHRPTGQVAWSGRLGSDAVYSHRLTQDQVQKLVNKLFERLR